MVEENQTPQVGTAVQNVRTVANPGGVEEIFADGISSVFSRGGVIKLDLFSVVGFDRENKTEERRVSHRLVVPVSRAAVAPIPSWMRPGAERGFRASFTRQGWLRQRPPVAPSP